jgi:chaperonin GroES
MQPIKTLVLVKPCKPDEKTENGLFFIPESFQKRKNKGEIVAVGKGTKDEPMLLKTGASVFNIKDCGVPVDINGEVHYLIQQRDILALDIS